MGYMIPVPIIDHFLKEVFSGNVYRGFPILPITFQTLENPLLRKYHGMDENQTGVRITRIDELCDAFHQLKPGDILLKIDAYPISNDGSVDIPGVGNCIDFVHLTHMKFINDTVSLKVLRKNPETNLAEIHHINVILDHVPHETEKVSQTEHDKMPTYFIASGISFIPLTRNYMEGKGGEFESYYLPDQGYRLADASKKTPDEQIIIINAILNCEETEGYESFENGIVKEINGKPIKKIQDVIEAIESNKKDMHYITTDSNRIIVVKNMTQEEMNRLLKLYKIHCDRSEDLLLPASPSVSNIDDPTINSENETMEESDSEHSIEDNDTAGIMPGKMRYLRKLDELENRYKNVPINDESDREDDDDMETSDEETQSLSSNDDADNDNDQPKTYFGLTKVQDKNRLFQKRPLDLDNRNDVIDPDRKRQKRM
jgi:PDZ domain